MKDSDGDFIRKTCGALAAHRYNFIKVRRLRAIADRLDELEAERQWTWAPEELMRHLEAGTPKQRQRIAELDAQCQRYYQEAQKGWGNFRAAEKRIAELEDELDDVRRDAESNEEQLGFLKDLQTQVNALFDVMDIRGDETLTASDTIEYAVEHLRNDKTQRQEIDALRKRIAELEQ